MHTRNTATGQLILELNVQGPSYLPLLALGGIQARYCLGTMLITQIGRKEGKTSGNGISPSYAFFSSGLLPQMRSFHEPVLSANSGVTDFLISSILKAKRKSESP